MMFGVDDPGEGPPVAGGGPAPTQPAAEGGPDWVTGGAGGGLAPPDEHAATAIATAAPSANNRPERTATTSYRPATSSQQVKPTCRRRRSRQPIRPERLVSHATASQDPRVAPSTNQESERSRHRRVTSRASMNALNAHHSALSPPPSHRTANASGAKTTKVRTPATAK